MGDGILAGLRITADPPPEALDLVLVHNAVVDMALAVLRNPTDEQVSAIKESAKASLGTFVTNEEVRAVLAAAAGSDDD